MTESHAPKSHGVPTQAEPTRPDPPARRRRRRTDESSGEASPQRDGAAPTGERDTERMAVFVERYAGILVDLGMAKMPARVMSAIYASPDGALTAAEIAEELRISPAAVSGAVRVLTGLSIVRREHVPGSRRDRYVIDADVWSHMLGPRTTWLNRLLQIAEEGIEAAGGSDTSTGARLAEMRDFFEFAMRDFADLQERWEKVRAERYGS